MVKFRPPAGLQLLATKGGLLFIYIYIHTHTHTNSGVRTHLGGGFGLAAAVSVVVVVRAGIGIFVNSVQEPEEELQGVVLRVTPKLRAVLGHHALGGRRS